jgi:hypothetical protein
MSPYATETDVRPARAGDCGCGCGGASGGTKSGSSGTCAEDCRCESRCCDLDCLVRPRFFCGQTLTDTDLSATIEWARSRFALARYRHGWGVVCGLDVTCHDPRGRGDCCPDPKKGPTVWVNPGYAIDCCGNDLVVCEPMAVCLSDCCRPADDPCSQTWQPIPPATKTNTQPAATEPADPQTNPTPEQCYRGLRHNLFAVELRLRYREKLAQPQRAMFRSGCDTSGCEYTRVLEYPCVRAEPVPLDCLPDDSKQWREDFDQTWKKVREEIERVASVDLDEVLKYLRKHPPHKFCFLDDLVCCFRGSGTRDSYEAKKNADRWRPLVQFWLFVDWYLHYLECACWSCLPDRGVPVGRVLMQRVKSGDSDTCRVVLIETSPPWRRPLHADRCRPIAPGARDLAPYLWQPLPYVTQQLREVGIRLDVSRNALELDSKAIEVIGRGPVEVGHDVRALRAYFVRDPFDCDRIVAFEPGPDR